LIDAWRRDPDLLMLFIESCLATAADSDEVRRLRRDQTLIDVHDSANRATRASNDALKGQRIGKVESDAHGKAYRESLLKKPATRPLFENASAYETGKLGDSYHVATGAAAALRGHLALDALLAHEDVRSVLDVGCGPGDHARHMADAGRRVIGVDDTATPGRYDPSNHGSALFVRDNYLDAEFAERFDAIWCCHMLEHVDNPQAILAKMRMDLREGGWLAITVPPPQYAVVGGHMTLWTAGQLLYHLVLAGFDCQFSARGSKESLIPELQERIIGSDPFGQMALQLYADEGVSTDNLHMTSLPKRSDHQVQSLEPDNKSTKPTSSEVRCEFYTPLVKYIQTI